MDTPPSAGSRWILVTAVGIGLALAIGSPAAAAGHPSADRAALKPMSICEFIPKWPGCPR